MLRLSFRPGFIKYGKVTVKNVQKSADDILIRSVDGVLWEVFQELQERRDEPEEHEGDHLPQSLVDGLGQSPDPGGHEDLPGERRPGHVQHPAPGDGGGGGGGAVVSLEDLKIFL